MYIHSAIQNAVDLILFSGADKV